MRPSATAEKIFGADLRPSANVQLTHVAAPQCIPNRGWSCGPCGIVLERAQGGFVVDILIDNVWYLVALRPDASLRRAEADSEAFIDPRQ